MSWSPARLPVLAASIRTEAGRGGFVLPIAAALAGIAVLLAAATAALA